MQQLRYAVAVADERHFGRAARACFISQPALSTQVRELESRLGAQLFERTSRGVLVTAVGEEVLGRARRILSELDDLCEAAGAGAELGASLRLGVIPTLAPYLLPAVVPAVEQAHAGLELYLREEGFRVTITDRGERALDIIRARPPRLVVLDVWRLA